MSSWLGGQRCFDEINGFLKVHVFDYYFLVLFHDTQGFVIVIVSQFIASNTGLHLLQKLNIDACSYIVQMSNHFSATKQIPNIYGSLD